MSPESLPEPIVVAGLIADQFERLGIAYVIGGSLASSVHGEPRATNDVDMVADLRTRDIDTFVDVVSLECYVSHDAVVEAVSHGASFNVIHIATAIKVDIFVAGADAFDLQRLERRQPVTFGSASHSVTLYVDTAEDTVLRKLEWYRRAGESSERQWRDVSGVFATQGLSLDRDYLHQWAARLGVEDLLDRALRPAR